MLSIQTFACHGIIQEGSQRVLLNRQNGEKDKYLYYDVIDVELQIRLKAPQMTKVFFLLIFACCREGYVSQKEKEAKNALRRGDENTNADSAARIANFTMLFGCDPANGVPANTKIVMVIT